VQYFARQNQPISAMDCVVHKLFDVDTTWHRRCDPDSQETREEEAKLCRRCITSRRRSLLREKSQHCLSLIDGFHGDRRERGKIIEKEKSMKNTQPFDLAICYSVDIRDLVCRGVCSRRGG
jgi:hypothetical protein